MLLHCLETTHGSRLEDWIGSRSLQISSPEPSLKYISSLWQLWRKVGRGSCNQKSLCQLHTNKLLTCISFMSWASIILSMAMVAVVLGCKRRKLLLSFERMRLTCSTWNSKDGRDWWSLTLFLRLTPAVWSVPIFKLQLYGLAVVVSRASRANSSDRPSFSVSNQSQHIQRSASTHHVGKSTSIRQPISQAKIKHGSCNENYEGLPHLGKHPTKSFKLYCSCSTAIRFF